MPDADRYIKSIQYTKKISPLVEAFCIINKADLPRNRGMLFFIDKSPGMF
jgi:hypothetical protein